MITFPDKFMAAMIAVRPLPGAPRYDGDDGAIVAEALSDLKHYQEAGADVILLENSHDLPYIKPPLPAKAIQLMTRIAREVRKRFKGPVGLQMLEAANITALEIAHAAKLDFIRTEAYVFAHVGGAGLIEGSAGLLHRRKKELNNSTVRFFADIKKKHCSQAITSDLSLADEIKQADFFLADGMIITGPRTGEAADPADLREARKATKLPIVIGSGMTPENLPALFPLADGFIVGSTFRENGAYLGRLDRKRLDAFMKVFLRLKRLVNIK